VRRRIRVAVFSTGAASVIAGAPRATAQLFDQPLHADGDVFPAAAGQRPRHLCDDRASLARGLKQVAAAHLI
jgi:hypothetical protein